MSRQSTRTSARTKPLSSALLGVGALLISPIVLAVPVQTSSSSLAPTSTLMPTGNATVSAPTATATPTVLAFQLVDSAAQSTVVHNNALPSASASPEEMSDSDSPMFYLGYDNAWDSTIDTLQSSLPNVTASNTEDPNDIRAQAFQQLPQAVRNGHSTLTYRVFFPLDFDFSKDARLPSIYSGRLGCANTRVRYTPDGMGELYLYNPTQSQTDALCSTPPLSSCDASGIHIGRGAWTFPRGKWMTIRHELWLNSPGLSDGGFNIWLDGQLVLSSHGVRYGERATRCLAPGGLDVRPPNELFDGCLPSPQARWVYGPAVRRKIYRPIPTLKVVTRIMTETAVPPAVTITQNIPVTVTQATTETKVNQVTVPTTVQITATETATATTTFTEIPEPTDPPVDDVPVEDPPEEDPPADEEAIPVAAAKAGHSIPTTTAAPVERRDDGMWKGINGYPGDVGYKGSPAVAPAPGYPFTFTFLQVVTLPGPVATVTVTKPLPKPKPKPAKKP